MNKKELLDRLRVIRIEVIQNDNRLNAYLANEYEEYYRNKAIKKWEQKNKEISKELNKIEKQIRESY